jgi:4-amino-4-deoxy-L-arabinose transferase-like glycosyltransferase
VLFVLALAPRLPGLRLFLTTDEPFFVERATSVFTALLQGDLRSTFWNFYPGVTIIWLDGLGLTAQWGLERLTGLTAQPFVQFLQRGVLDLMVAIRVPYALLSALFVVGVYVLMRRLLDTRTAILGALLVAWDPFFLAHSRVPHGDGPAAVFMGLSILAFLLHVRKRHTATSTITRWLVLSAISGGLAALSKAPGPFVLVFVVLTGVGDWAWRSWRAGRLDRQLGGQWLVQLAVWAGLAGVTYVALWPALWVDPIGTLTGMAEETFGRVEAGHLVFFMGQPTLDPGPWFYPYVTAFRLTPIVLIGLLASGAMVLWVWISNRWRKEDAVTGASAHWRTVGLLWLFAIALLLFGELSPKKQDRYLLPIYPFLDLLAASALGWFCAALTPRRPLPEGEGERKSGSVVGAIALVALLGLHAYPVLTAYPYYLAYFNPLMGGLPRAVETTLVGWGEGMERAATYLNEQPDAERLYVAAVPAQTLLPYFKGTGENFYTNDVALRADKVVLYISQVQRLAPSPEIVRYFRAMEPEHVVTVLGVPYAWIYPGPKPILKAVPPDVVQINIGVGGQLRLAGYGVSCRNDTAEVTLYWHALAAMDTDYTISVRLIGADGKWLAQHDSWPVNGLLPTRQLRPDDIVRDVHTFRLADATQIGMVQVVVYDAVSGQALAAPMDLPFPR